MVSHRDSDLSGSSADVDPTGYDVDDHQSPSSSSSSSYVDHAYSRDRSRRISSSGQSDKIIFTFFYQFPVEPEMKSLGLGSLESFLDFDKTIKMERVYQGLRRT